MSEEPVLARAVAGSSPHGAKVWAGFEGERETISGTDAEQNAARLGKNSQVGKDRRKDNKDKNESNLVGSRKRWLCR